MNGSSLGSVTLWLERLKKGDDEAASRLWDRYFKKLAGLARRRLKNGGPDADADADDVALSALNSVFLAARNGRYQGLDRRTKLWALLITITVHKAANKLKHQYAQKRSPLSEYRGADAVKFTDNTPSPESRVEIAEELQHLLDGLNDDLLSSITLLRLEGHTVQEIAAKLQRSERTIFRKLARIRQEWVEALS